MCKCLSIKLQLVPQWKHTFKHNLLHTVLLYLKRFKCYLERYNIQIVLCYQKLKHYIEHVYVGYLQPGVWMETASPEFVQLAVHAHHCETVNAPFLISLNFFHKYNFQIIKFFFFMFDKTYLALKPNNLWQPGLQSSISDNWP